MTEQSEECARRLKSALGPAVQLPGSDGYRRDFAGVFFPDAARRRPACVVQPAAVADVSATLRIVEGAGVRLAVRGGGLSSNCVADDAVMLDLSARLHGVRHEGGRVLVEGGATVAAMLASLAPHTLGVYSAELRPGFPETAAEIEAAYGGNSTGCAPCGTVTIAPGCSQAARCKGPREPPVGGSSGE
ncbi:FAD-binding protein [Rhodococcus sp. NPDC059234]|uniref:FAD-binding protein n=1 Tax=Rhodococcus sp. NPDC059234 TaxID=3346781 RepID=UPI00366B4B07